MKLHKHEPSAPINLYKHLLSWFLPDLLVLDKLLVTGSGNRDIYLNLCEYIIAPKHKHVGYPQILDILK